MSVVPRARARRGRRGHPPVAGVALALGAAGVVAGCSGERASVRGTRLEALPVMLNAELPFRYPAVLYARRVQGNVTLRLFIDSLGHVQPESTIVAESSGYPELDSAAVVGSQELHFRPARASGAPTAVAVLFPIFFRHPSAPPLPGDSILK